MTDELRTVREDFYSKPLSPVAGVTLVGTQCNVCGEVFLGDVAACLNCQSYDLTPLPLSREGTLYSYTVVRNRPPGDYKGPSNPFMPYPVGLVELPEGVRILSVMDCPLGAVEIGMPLVLVIAELYRDDENRPVLSHKFIPSNRELAR